jgi:hypothetical protein
MDHAARTPHPLVVAPAAFAVALPNTPGLACHSVHDAGAGAGAHVADDPASPCPPPKSVRAPHDTESKTQAKRFIAAHILAFLR